MELAPGWIQYTAGNRVLSDMIDLQMNDGSRQFNVRIEQRDSILHPNVVAYRSHVGVPQPVTLIEARKAILELFESQGEYYATDEVALDIVADYLNQQVAVAAPVVNDGWIAQGGPDWRWHNDDVLDIFCIDGTHVQSVRAQSIDWNRVVKFRRAVGHALAIFDLSEIRRIASRVARSDVVLPNHSARIVDYLNQQVAVAVPTPTIAALQAENAKLRKYVESALCDRVGDLVKSERANLGIDLIVTVAIQ